LSPGITRRKPAAAGVIGSSIREMRLFGAKIGGDLAGRKDDDVTVPRCDPDYVAKLGSVGRIIDPAGFGEQGPKGHAGEACLLDAVSRLVRDRDLVGGKPLQSVHIQPLRMLHLAAQRHDQFRFAAVVGGIVRSSACPKPKDPKTVEADEEDGGKDPMARGNIGPP
jgi:hypothetical protein